MLHTVIKMRAKEIWSNKQLCSKRDFGPSNYHLIPPHGRWQHFEVGNVPRIDRLLAHWDNQGYSATEKARSLVDLFFVSVLLDAGAGDVWKFHESSSDAFYSRSEGIAIASYHMFLGGDFASSSSPRKDIVDGEFFFFFFFEIQ